MVCTLNVHLLKPVVLLKKIVLSIWNFALKLIHHLFSLSQNLAWTLPKKTYKRTVNDLPSNITCMWRMLLISVMSLLVFSTQNSSKQGTTSFMVCDIVQHWSDARLKHELPQTLFTFCSLSSKQQQSQDLLSHKISINCRNVQFQQITYSDYAWTCDAYNWWTKSMITQKKGNWKSLCARFSLSTRCHQLLSKQRKKFEDEYRRQGVAMSLQEQIVGMGGEPCGDAQWSRKCSAGINR